MRLSDVNVWVLKTKELFVSGRDGSVGEVEGEEGGRREGGEEGGEGRVGEEGARVEGEVGEEETVGGDGVDGGVGDGRAREVKEGEEGGGVESIH